MKIPDEARAYFSKLGKKGGKNRAKKLTAEQRKEIARKGGLARGKKV